MLTLLLYKCPDLFDFVEIQLHDADHNILGAKIVPKDLLLRKIEDNEPVVLYLESWSDVQARITAKQEVKRSK